MQTTELNPAIIPKLWDAINSLRSVGNTPITYLILGKRAYLTLCVHHHRAQYPIPVTEIGQPGWKMEWLSKWGDIALVVDPESHQDRVTPVLGAEQCALYQCR